jgi:HlyD family secretion protein
VKKFLIGIILLGILAGAGVVWYSSQQHVIQHPPKTEKVSRIRIVEKVSSMGKIAPKDLVIVGIDVPAARIAEVFPKCEINNKVAKDQPLFRLDDTLAQARLKEAESTLSAAEAGKKQAEAKRDNALAALKRAQVQLDTAVKSQERAARINAENKGEPLAKAKLEEAEDLAKLAEQGVANANANVKEAEAGILAAEAVIFKAKAGVDVAKKGLEVMTISAPIAGTILERDKRVRAGQIVSAQMSPLFVISPENPQWELYVQVGEYDVHKITKGMRVQFTVDAYSEDHSVQFEGRVSNIADLPTTQTRNSELPAGISGPVFFTITVDVTSEKPTDRTTDQAHPLRAGLSANVDFTIVEITKEQMEKNNLVTVPNAALNYQPENLSAEEQKKIEERTSSKSRVSPLFVWNAQEKKERLIFVRRLATDGSYTAVEPLDGEKLEPNNTEVVTEAAPPPEKGGLFSKPIKGVGLN